MRWRIISVVFCRARVAPLRIKFIGKAVKACGNAAGRLHLGLRGQILLLGVAGVLVVGAIYLAGLQVEQKSQREAERFGALESLTAKVSENLLQAREIATQFMQKPTDKKVAAHDETVKAALGLSDALAQLTFSIALFTMAFATLVYGSLSDRYGRRPVLLSGLGLFLELAEPLLGPL